MICQVCKKEGFSNLHALATHLARSHKDITTQNYYDQFIEHDDLSCPECGKKRQFKNLTIGYLSTCGNKKCRYADVQKKKEETNLQRYGTKNPFQNEEVRKAAFEKYKEKTGYDTPLSNPEVIAKRQKNLTEQYGEGISNVFQLDEVKQKSRQTLEDRFGENVSSPTLIPEIRAKQIASTIENHGVDTVLRKKEVREKGQDVQQERYGVRFYLQSEAFNEKRDEYLQKQYQTNMERYGVKSQFDNPEIRNKGIEAQQAKYGTPYFFESEEFRKRLPEYLQKQYKTNLDRYGVRYQFERAEIRNKAIEATIKRYGVPYYFQSDEFVKRIPEIVQKRTETNLQKYGVRSLFEREDVRQKGIDATIEHYGVPYYFQSDDYKNRLPEMIEKWAQANMEKYGVKSQFERKEVKDKAIEATYAKYNVPYYFQSEEFKERSIEIEKKRIETNLQKYGVPYYFQSSEFKERLSEILEKQYETKRKSGTFNTSQVEDDIYEILLSRFSDVKRQYQDERYPFNCDFYIPSTDTFIEVDAHWTHGPEPYNPSKITHKQLLSEWQEKVKLKESSGEKTKFLNLAIDVWTKRDVEKRRIAHENSVRLVSLKTIEDAVFFCSRPYYNLSATYTQDECDREIRLLKTKEGSYNSRPYMNRIVLTYQPHFYERERQVFLENSVERNKLISNREQYLGKPFEQLSDRQLLRGFKISGTLIGFSHFSPFWAKAFYEEYQPGLIYDPFGGWGHRLLGFMSVPYIYNDIDSRSCQGVENMIKDFNLPNKIVYCMDAYKQTPLENYDTVFTCPPYYDTEDYQYSPIDKSYRDWVNEDWRSAIKVALKPSVKIFAFVIIDRMADDLQKVCEEEGLIFIRKQIVGYPKGSHFVQGKQHFEELIVLKQCTNFT